MVHSATRPAKAFANSSFHPSRGAKPSQRALALQFGKVIIPPTEFLGDANYRNKEGICLVLSYFKILSSAVDEREFDNIVEDFKAICCGIDSDCDSDASSVSRSSSKSSSASSAESPRPRGFKGLLEDLQSNGEMLKLDSLIKGNYEFCISFLEGKLCDNGFSKNSKISFLFHQLGTDLIPHLIEHAKKHGLERVAGRIGTDRRRNEKYGESGKSFHHAMSIEVKRIVDDELGHYYRVEFYDPNQGVRVVHLREQDLAPEQLSSTAMGFSLVDYKIISEHFDYIPAKTVTLCQLLTPESCSLEEENELLIEFQEILNPTVCEDLLIQVLRRQTLPVGSADIGELLKNTDMTFGALRSEEKACVNLVQYAAQDLILQGILQSHPSFAVLLPSLSTAKQELLKHAVEAQNKIMLAQLIMFSSIPNTKEFYSENKEVLFEVACENASLYRLLMDDINFSTLRTELEEYLGKYSTATIDPY